MLDIYLGSTPSRPQVQTVYGVSEKSEKHDQN